MLRYLYGVPTSLQEQHEDLLGAMHWRELFGVVNQFGIPSLRKSAMARLESHLEDLLKQGFSGGQKSIGHFVWEVRQIYISENYKDSEATELTAKLTCKHFVALREHEAFNDLTDQYPEYSRTVLDHAAREGMLGQG